MADRNRELVPDNWSLVRERTLTTGLCAERFPYPPRNVSSLGRCPARVDVNNGPLHSPRKVGTRTHLVFHSVKVNSHIGWFKQGYYQ